MDHPDIMSPLNQVSDYSAAFSAERDYSNAVREAVKLHCQDKYIPEEIARFCRALAVNLNRNLARSKFEQLPTLGHLEDYSCDTPSNCTPASFSSKEKPATEIGMGYPEITT